MRLALRKRAASDAAPAQDGPSPKYSIRFSGVWCAASRHANTPSAHAAPPPLHDAHAVMRRTSRRRRYNSHSNKEGEWRQARRVPLDPVSGRVAVFVADHSHGMYPSVRSGMCACLECLLWKPWQGRTPITGRGGVGVTHAIVRRASFG